MNILFLKKNLCRALLASVAFMALSAHASTHFISGFVTKQPVAIPNVYLIDGNNVVTKVTGKLGGSMMGGGGAIDFTAIKIGHLFLAQTTVDGFKKGVFFQVKNNHIKVISAHDCSLDECQDRDLLLVGDDPHRVVASSQTVGDYGIFDLTLTITHIRPHERFVAGFIPITGVAIPGTPPIKPSDFIDKIEGRIDGPAISYKGKPVDYTLAMEKLGDRSFLAQVDVGEYQKGVFFQIDNNNVKTTAARSCLSAGCQNRNLVLTDQPLTIIGTAADAATATAGINISNLKISVIQFNPNEHFITDFVSTQAVIIPRAHLINANNVVTKITGRFTSRDSDNISTTIGFTAIRLDDHSFLAQITLDDHKRGVFFEIKDGKIKATAARSCRSTDCLQRNLTLADTHETVADSKEAGGYGIFHLILSTRLLDFNERFIPGFVATQPVVIPNYRGNNKSDMLVNITGKFGGSDITGDDRVNFTAIKLSKNSFLAQIATADQDHYKKGVFFTIEGNKIQATSAHYCAFADCKNRNLTVSDPSPAGGVSDSQVANGYGILDLVVSMRRFNVNEHFVSGFITEQAVVVPNAHLITANNVVKTITGKFAGSAIGAPVDFSAIHLGGNSFLAQAVVGSDKKGIFFEIENGKIKATAAHYCALSICQTLDIKRNVHLSDTSATIANSPTAADYGIFDLTLSTRYAGDNKHFITNFVTDQGIDIPNADLINASNIITEITGKFGGASVGDAIDFTAISLGNNSFLAQVDAGIYKKGVFFEIDGNSGKIKVTASRYCLLTECQNRNLALTDVDIGTTAVSQTTGNYGIFDLTITTTHLDGNQYFIPDFASKQPVATQKTQENIVVTKVTGKFYGVDFIDDFTAVPLGAGEFLAQVISGSHKKAVFFEIKKGVMKATSAAYCNISDCRTRNVRTDDTPLSIANSQESVHSGVYSIFNLVISTASLDSNQRLVPGFMTNQGVDIPDAASINASNIVTKITGQFTGDAMNNSIDFTAMPLGGYSFLAQVIADGYKKGVFFKVENNKVKTVSAHSCPLTDCENRMLSSSDRASTIANGQTVGSYGISNLILSTTRINSNNHFIPSFIGRQPMAIPDNYLMNESNPITHITGKFGGRSTHIPINFTAIKLSKNSFLAQVDVGGQRKGVFFEIDDNYQIKVTHARFCSIKQCQNRNLTLDDERRSIATHSTSLGYGIFDLMVSTTPLAQTPRSRFVSGFIGQQPVAIPNAGVLTNGSYMVTKITGKLGGYSISTSIDGAPNFTAIKLGAHSFLAQVDLGIYKKGVFFKILHNNKIEVTAARYCLLTECQNRNLALTDTVSAIADSQAVSGYGIFDLTLSMAPVTKGKFTKTGHHIPGVIGAQGADIPTIQPDTLITEVTGKLGGKMATRQSDQDIPFRAIKLGNNSYLAQISVFPYKVGVFFEIENNKIKNPQGRYCSIVYNTEGCLNRNVALSDKQSSPTGNHTAFISDLTVWTSPVTTHHFPDFVPTTGVAANFRILPASLIAKITGKLGGASMGEPFDFTATSLGGGSFLAQADVGVHKKGVFFEIDSDGKIKTTAARYCLNTECRNRDLALTDTTYVVATSHTVTGYGIFDLTVSMMYDYFIPGFLTENGTDAFMFSNVFIDQITGSLGGTSIGKPVDFVAIKLSNNWFLAQANFEIYKKGVFFEIDDNDGKIKVIAARYCLLTECQNRNITLRDKIGVIADSQTGNGYGVFDLSISVLTNLALNKPTTQSSTYPDGISSSSNAVDGSTNGAVRSNSVTSTRKEKGAWWQVDLGGPKLIKKIRIFNRTDCCKDRLSNYRVSVSHNADFTTTTYQEVFQAYPDPQQTIDFSLPSVQGGYVKIQLLGNNYLPLAEVEVFGHDLLPEEP